MSLARKNLLFYSIAVLVLFSIFIAIVFTQSRSLLVTVSSERASAALQTFEGVLNGSGLKPADPAYAETIQAELDQLAKGLEELEDFTVYDIEKQAAIASSTPENRNKPIDPEDIEAAKNDETVILVEEEEGETVVDVTAPLHLDGKITNVVGVMISMQDELDKINKLLLFMLVCGIVGLDLAIALIWFFVIRKTTNQLKHLMDVTGRLSGGDLTARANAKGKDEVARLAQNINSMSDSLSHIIGNVTGNSQSITSHSVSLADSTVQTTASLEEIAKTVEELARGASDQTAEAKTGFEKLLKLAGQINDVMEHSNRLEQRMNRTEAVNGNGKNALAELEQKLQTNNEISSSIAENANNLMIKSSTISEIVNTIHSVADQTNLLALNAAIEAARAGEQGKGFSVVADEIRKLAEQTSDSTKSISRMISEIQKEIQATKSNIDKGEESLKVVNGKLYDTTCAFDEISSTVKDSIEGIESLISGMQMIDKDKDEVVELIQRISDISENTAAATQEVSASVEEQTATMQTISASSDNLSSIAGELETLIRRFRIE